MPLCWSHAEYVSLVRSRHDGIGFHRVDPAYQRYTLNPVPNRYEIWTLRHALRRVSLGKTLRIILAEEAKIVWSTDNWARTNESQMTHQEQLDLWYADFPSAEWPAGSAFAFTIFWKREQRWEQRNWQVSVV
jgi:glucoamylase